MVNLSVIRLRQIVLGPALIAVTLLTGCSDSGIDRPTVVPVSGVVLYNGDPVVGASVSFMAENAPRAATGVTNDKGEFRLTTFELNDGAVIGKHLISVVKKEAGAAPAAASSTDKMLSDPTAMTGAYTQQMGVGGAKSQDGPKSLIPARYEVAGTSGLSEEVKADAENRFVLQLTD
ncbi:MAG TPA: hypothetical protein VLA12_16985 [Planctomycetaceae bacterium]|nr:hypothetical protein [Planctomycetaceae bacterium]